MLVQLSGSAVFGVDAHLITIEVNVDRGIGYHLVGLPFNTAVWIGKGGWGKLCIFITNEI